MKHLNDEQHQAVVHVKGPLLIVAGAGTGKTTVLTERIKYLIQHEQVAPHQIFAATFTEKAAEEMLARLDVVMPLGYQEPWIGTFHSLCDRILRLEGLEMGLNPEFTLMTQTDQWLFIKEHLFAFDLKYYRPLGNPARFIGALIKFFSRLTDEDISKESLSALAAAKARTVTTEEDKHNADRLAELAAAFERYQELKREFDKLDFGDLITLTLSLLRNRPNIRDKYRKAFSYLMIDEFQDTNTAQFELIKLLAPPDMSPNLMVVGDDDQSIYKFRGASVSNILTFKNVYPDAAEIVLTRNYRSTQAILDGAYHCITNNNPDRLEAKLGIDKKLVSEIVTDKKNVQPTVQHFATLEDEVAWTTMEISRLITDEQLQPKDIAVIVRANAPLEAYMLALKQAEIPYQLVTNRGLYDQEEVSSLLTLMKVLADPNDSTALMQLMLSPLFGFTSETLLTLMQQVHATASTLWLELQKTGSKEARRLVSLIEEYRKIALEKTVTQLLYGLMSKLKYVQQFTKDETLENQLKIKNLNLFFNQLKRFEATSTDKSIIGFLHTFSMWEEAGENPGQAQIEDIDTVSLMTVHKSKGLEFEAVFVGGMVVGRFPSTTRKDPIELPDELVRVTVPEGDEHLEEERRLFYVALTRAKRWLYVTYADDVGGVRKRKMSGFCAETEFPILSPNVNSEINEKSQQATAIVPGHFHDGNSVYKIESVSYSQIDTFTSCPLKFKYRYLLKIPTRSHHSLSFGQTMHQTLYDFHLAAIQNHPMTLPDLTNQYQRNFIEEGYESEAHKKARYESGLRSLEHYYFNHAAVLGKPIMLEQSFSIKLKNAVLKGKIDRVDERADGHYEIVDYKTGEAKKQADVDKDDQLTIYALAAQSIFSTPVDQMSLYFLEQPGLKLSTIRREADILKAKEKLEKKIDQMQTSDFPGKPDPVKCGFCEYYDLCPLASKKKIL